MKIVFANGVELPYTNAVSMERDFKNGYTRPSIEVTIPYEATSFSEIEGLMGMDFTLVGDIPTDSIDNMPIGNAPVSGWENYSIKGKITVEDNSITFKCYKLSESEIAIDDLLLMILLEEEDKYDI